MQYRSAISNQDTALYFFEEAPRSYTHCPYFFHAILIRKIPHVTHAYFSREIKHGLINHLIARKKYTQWISRAKQTYTSQKKYDRSIIDIILRSYNFMVLAKDAKIRKTAKERDKRTVPYYAYYLKQYPKKVFTFLGVSVFIHFTTGSLPSFF